MSRGGRMEPSQRQNQGQCLNSRSAAAFLSVHDEFPGSLQENLLIAMHRSAKLLSMYYTLWDGYLCQRVFGCWSRWQRLEFACHPIICTPGCRSLLPPLLFVAYESTGVKIRNQRDRAGTDHQVGTRRCLLQRHRVLEPRAD